MFWEVGGERVLFTEAAGYVSVGAHICAVHEDSDEVLEPLRDVFLVGLGTNDCCVYIASPESVRKLRGLLKSAGVDVEAREKRGDIVFISEREELLKDEVEFEPDHALSIKGTLFQDKVRAGYDVVRLCEDVSWLIRGTPGRERMTEYEVKVDESVNVPGVPMIAICQYRLEDLEPAGPAEILKLHPLKLVGGLVLENPTYEPSKPVP